MKERLKRLPFVAAIYRALHPSNSTCGCCGLPWAVVKNHTIHMEENDRGGGSGFFPVCEYCWQHKPQKEINKAIERLYRWWEYDCGRAGVEVPYKLDDMLKCAAAQHNPEIMCRECSSCSKKCKTIKYFIGDCKNKRPLPSPPPHRDTRQNVTKRKRKNETRSKSNQSDLRRLRSDVRDT